jgi:hypothetical protein
MCDHTVCTRHHITTAGCSHKKVFTVHCVCVALYVVHCSDEGAKQPCPKLPPTKPPSLSCFLYPSFPRRTVDSHADSVVL